VSEWLIHGGEVDTVAERYGIPRDQWLDLSTGINPNPYPVPELSREYWYRLPDAQLLSWLVESACGYLGVGDGRFVVPAPGTQALIQWLPWLIEKSRVAIFSPTYEEHRLAWSDAGHEVIEISHDDIPPPGTSVIIVANPNNPDGTTMPPHRLLPLTQSALVIVDEAFVDVMPEISLSSHAGQRNLIVLRSFGKFFGLAGMRLGFALAWESFAERLKRALGPWAVPGPAAAVGAIAMTDETWIRLTRVRLKAASSRLDGLLMRSGLKPLGGTTLFRLVADERALDLYHHLALQGVLTRRFPENPQWLRFGLPADDKEFDRLSASLGSWRPRAQRTTASGGERR
jgi:cobalamin biosynthetic protein CobC